MLSLKKTQEIEYRSYGLYSEVAKDTGYTISDIEAVYSWYLNRTLEDMISGPTLKVYLKNLGRFELDFGAALRYMRGHVTGLEEAYLDYMDGNDRGWITAAYFQKRYSQLEKALKSLRVRLDKIKEVDGIRELVYVNKEAKLSHIEKHLKKLYEPIQRIPEHELKRSPELGQSNGGDVKQDSKGL
jgi:hypothetical protein